MNDIVERLRFAPHSLLNLGPNAEKLMKEAADEIELLRAARDQAKSWLCGNANAEKEPKARAAFIEASNAVLAIFEGRA